MEDRGKVKEGGKMKEFDLAGLVEPILSWYDENKRTLPWRGTRDPYRVWISEIMLQQTRVEAVMGYFARFTTACPDIASLAAIDDDALMKLWQGLGYYSRARNLKKAANEIVLNYGGEMPTAYDEIVSLPGIGTYTAGAIASIAFDEPVPAVDGNVLRILSRVRCDERDVMKESTKKAVREDLLAIMPKRRSGELNQAFMDLGATVCIPNGEPLCDSCPWSGMCLAEREGRTSELPRRKKPKGRRVEERTIIVIKDGERVLLHKRPDKGLLAGLYEPVNIEGEKGEGEVIELVREIGLDPLRVEKLSPAKHVFSHIEWHMHGYAVRVADATGYRDDGGYVLVERQQVRDGFSIPSAYAAYMEDMR